MAYEGLEENKNAEKWDEEKATSFMHEALELSKNDDYDFLGEIAKELNSYIDVFDYLSDKFPELKAVKKHIKRNCETNCFSNGKKGKINTSMAIVNLKSNHKWTDRADLTTGGETINTPPIIQFVDTDENEDKIQ